MSRCGGSRTLTLLLLLLLLAGGEGHRGAWPLGV